MMNYPAYAQGANQISTGQNRVENASSAPRELGVIERLIGIRAGTCNLAEQLEAFVSRLSGEGQQGQIGKEGAPGITSILDDSEANLRRCFEILSALNKAF